jgi:hypothetical protein
MNTSSYIGFKLCILLYQPATVIYKGFFPSAIKVVAP